MIAREPVCPDCGESVGSTSTYCMHCDATYDTPADDAPQTERTPAGETTDREYATLSGRQRWSEYRLKAHLHAIAAGFVGMPATIFVTFAGGVAVRDDPLLFTTVLGIALLIGGVITVTVFRRRSPRDTVADACYGFALSIVATPLVATAVVSATTPEEAVSSGIPLGSSVAAGFFPFALSFVVAGFLVRRSGR